MRLLAVAVAALALAGSALALPPLQTGWPRTLQIGLTDSPGGAAALRRSAPFGFRYQYLAGGANTGQGWASRSPDGSFVTLYGQESFARGIDNRVQWLLGDGSRGRLARWVAAGFVGFLFGGGADGTCACDAAGDGVTNPRAIDGNTRRSLSADDDGSYFRDRVRAYYRAGALALPR